MLNLIRSDLAKLVKLRSFWLFMVLTLIIDFFLTDYWHEWVLYYDVQRDLFSYLEKFVLLCIGLMTEGAVIIGNLIGSDHTYRTVANKITAGYTKTEIFISGWITSFICMMILTVWSYTVTAISSLYFGDLYYADAQTTITFLGMTFLFILVCTAFFTSLYMIVLPQSTSMTIGIITVSFVIIATAIAEADISDLIDPKYINANTARQIEEAGIEVQRDPDDPDRFISPSYIEGGSGLACITDIWSPVSHLIYPHDDRLDWNIAAMSGEIILFTAAGLLVFRRRDVR